MGQSFLKITILVIFCLSLITPTLQCNCTCSNESHSAVDVPIITAPVAASAVNKSDCSNIVYSMMGCLSYLLDDSTDVNPTQACCDGIKAVVDYNPHCLCVGLEGSKKMGFDVNTTRALASPVTCHLSKSELTCAASSPPVAPSPPPVSSPVKPSPPPVKPSPPIESPVTPTPPPVKPSPPIESPVTPTPPPVTSPVKPSPPPVKPTPPIESPVTPTPPPVTSPVKPSPPPVKPTPPVESPVKPSPAPIVAPVKPTPVIAPTQPPAPVPSSNSDCSSVVYDMMDCLSFLSPGSTDLKPSKSCCDGIKTVVEYNSTCLCVGLEGSRNLGFDLNDTRAYNMPTICDLTIDPHCVSINPPTSSPTPPVSSQKPPVSSARSPVSSPKTPAASRPIAAAPGPAISGSMDLTISKSFLVLVLFSFVFIF